MNQINLEGKWLFTKKGDRKFLSAIVPGCVHTDLLTAKKIPDPFFRDNEKELQWIGQSDWLYSRTFKVSAKFLKSKRILLRCEGLDTLATIKINNKKVAQTDNMYRTWEFDVKDALKPGDNAITILFSSAEKYCQKKQKQDPIPTWPVGGVGGRNCHWIRKEPCNFGWDWGPKLVTCGIWRDIKLIAFNKARLTDIQILQHHFKNKSVKLQIALQTEIIKKSKLTAQITLNFKNRKIASKKITLKGKAANINLLIKEPKLWWPNGLGPQHLYSLNIKLLDEQGNTIDSCTKQIGLRTLTLESKKDRFGQSFQFVINGRPFFAKGANWIPANVFNNRITAHKYRSLLKNAVDANMNMLRVWGGGIYENDIFYDLCDHLGICVWQDFMFACDTYPTFESEFMNNVKAEAEDNIKRLRHHPCIALWCGNNELEMLLLGDKWTDKQMSRKDYAKLFDKLLPGLVKKLDPERQYWPSSPHTPGLNRNDFNNPDRGDAHLWDVWHGLKPFEWFQSTNHRFVSEFGFQSFTEPKTTNAFTLPKDRNITSPVMEHHQKSRTGNTNIMTYMLDWFKMPKNFEMTVYLSQILQAIGIKYAVEHFRRSMPQTMGALYWQLNDCWPGPTWSSIDSFGRWKALHYFSRRFFGPVLVSARQDSGKVDVYVTSDSQQVIDAKLKWSLTTTAGKEIEKNSLGLKILSTKSKRVKVLNFAKYIKQYGPQNLMLWLNLNAKGKCISSNLITFVKPKHMQLLKPKIKAKINKCPDGSYRVQLKADKPALWAWVELTGIEAVISDNFINLPGQKNISIKVKTKKPVNKKKFIERLRIRSLTDVY
jgi:beta-mannosidase